jgi:hypothetical protein
MSNTTLTLQSVVNFASIHAELLPLSSVGGYSLEPALSLCNDTLQETTAQPNAWKHNRAELGIFVTTTYRQDYLFGGAVAFTLEEGGAGIALASASTPGVVRTGTTVVVTTLEPHNMTVGRTLYMFGNTDAQFNSIFSQGPNSSGFSGGWTITAVTANTITFTHLVSGSTNSGAPGITNYAWLESGTMREINSTAPIPKVWQLEGVNDLHPTSISSRPTKVAVLSDNGDGTLKIRMQYAPGGTFYAVALVYQMQPPLKVALSDTWTPFPDRFGFVIRQAFLARAYRFMSSAKADAEYQKSEFMIAKATGADDAEQSDQRIYPEQSLMDLGDVSDDF